MDIKQLHLFLTVVEHGSFTRAADALSIAQSVASHHVSQLESDVQQPLLRRHGRGVVPTEAGLRLAEHARTILGQVQRAKDELDSFRDKPTGRVAVGLGPLLGRIISTPLILEVRDQFPDVTLNVHEMPSINIAEWLAAGRLDVGVTYAPLVPDSYCSKAIFDAELCLVSRAEGAAGAPAPFIRFKEISRVPLIMWGDADSCHSPTRSPWLTVTRSQVENAAAAANITLNVASNVGESLGASQVLDLVKSGEGAAILPFHLVYGGNHVHDRALTVQIIVEPSLSIPLSVAMRPRPQATAAAKAVANMIESLIVDRLTRIRRNRLESASRANVEEGCEASDCSSMG